MTYCTSSVTMTPRQGRATTLTGLHQQVYLNPCILQNKKSYGFFLSSDFNVHGGPVDTAFVVEHLSYKSPYSDQLLVEDLSMKISQGTHLLVVGNTGTGKTSLLRILNRLWEADSGKMTEQFLQLSFLENWRF